MVVHLAWRYRFLVTLLGVVLSACSTTEEATNRPVEELYNTAKDYMDQGRYNKAAQSFAEVEQHHPYSVWALKAQLLSAYSYYEAKKYDEAIEGFRVFIQLHPGHEHIPYAYYMVGLCYYEQIPNIKRDQEVSVQAQKAFEEVIRRFPTSPYARDAQLKLDLIQDHLAGKEMDVGRFYLGQKAYLAALNRFKTVVDQYQTSTHTPEALHRMVECYLAQGIVDQAYTTAAVLGHNYPGSPWYADSYQMMTSLKRSEHLPDKQTKAPVSPGSVAASEATEVAHTKPPVK
jgi:outer membrane protein assembly factor BamD